MQAGEPEDEREVRRESGEGSGRQRAGAGDRLGGWHDDATEPTVRTATWSSWFQKLDQIVVPGRAQADEDEEDNKAFPARFASAVCGHGEGASGFARVSAERVKHKVAREYDTLSAYSCTICKRNVAGNVAMRPSTESLRLFRAGPRVKQAPHNCDLEDIHGVYTEEHEQQMLAAGFERISVRLHNPGMPLPDGIEPLGDDVGAAPRKKPRGASSMVHLQQPAPPPPPAESSMPASSMKLSMPRTGVPGWQSRSQLIEMMEKPFYLTQDKARIGPYTPVYMWPSGSGKTTAQARRAAGAPKFTSSLTAALGRLFEDYYNLTVREAEVRDHLRQNYPQLFTTKDGSPCDPLTASDVKIPKFWRSMKQHSGWEKPQGFATWRDVVLNHLRDNLSAFQEPGEILEEEEED